MSLKKPWKSKPFTWEAILRPEPVSKHLGHSTYTQDNGHIWCSDCHKCLTCGSGSVHAAR